MPRRLTKNTPSKTSGSKRGGNTGPTTEMRAGYANAFFDELFTLLDAESDLVTNAEADLEMRTRMRRAVKCLKNMLADMQRFHGHRFSTASDRIDLAAVEASKLVRDCNVWVRGEHNLENVSAVNRFDERTSLQPVVFGSKSSSVLRATLRVVMYHYVRFDDAFEESGSPHDLTMDAFGSLCARLDQMPSLSFNAPTPAISIGPVTRKPGRGRPKVADPDETEILREWNSGKYKSYKECAAKITFSHRSNILPWKRVQRVVVCDNQRQSRARRTKNNRA